MYRDIAPGDGASVGPESTVTVEYIGVACSTGKVFATSYVRSEPATYQMNGVIPGWREGLEGMRVGGRRLLSVPPRLAYGDKGLEPDIAPGETLWFVVDLMEVQNP
ncbi:MAG: FKBP-type peptidyl-prolyl cis-trans isomerase [Actinobacteria bacterium]|nr:FKBP-type peptidyl-prolyl cis-trans isomerase [Actinomycetota bacterium]